MGRNLGREIGVIKKQYDARNIICQSETGKTREYRDDTIREALFSTGKNAIQHDTEEWNFGQI